MNIKSENLIAVNGAKAGQRAILKGGKAILVGIGGLSAAAGAGSIPSTTGDYVLPYEFKDSVKIAFWRNYDPVQTIYLNYTAGGEDTSRVWSNTDGWTLSFLNGKWTVTWWNSSIETAQPVATNATLRKHKWTIIEPPVTPDKNVEFDFVSLEDKNWIYNG